MNLFDTIMTITEHFYEWGNEAFLITKNNNLKSKQKKNEKNKEIKENNTIVKVNKNLPILKELENTIPNIDFPDIITLDKYLIIFLSNYIEITEFLPHYVNALFKENKKIYINLRMNLIIIRRLWRNWIFFDCWNCKIRTRI